MGEKGGEAEKLHIRTDLCTRVQFSASNCQKCLVVCPVNAIQFIDQSLSIAHSCIGCEFCVVACPNEVFTVPVERDEQEKPTDDLECIYCSKLLTNDCDILKSLPMGITPCIGSLPVHSIINWLLEKNKPLKVVTGLCDQCEMKTGLSTFRKVEVEAKSILESLKIPVDPVITQQATGQDRRDARELYLHYKKRQEEKANLSRRDFLAHFRGHLFPTGTTTTPEKPSGSGFRMAEKKLPERLSTIIALFKEKQAVFSEGDKASFYSEIDLDDSCTGCGVCASLCPTGALSLKRGEKIVHLSWTPSHCSQCDLCKEACPKSSIQFFPGLAVQKIVDESTTVIKTFHRNICPECNREYLSHEAAVPCPYCRKQQKVLEDITQIIYGEGYIGTTRNG